METIEERAKEVVVGLGYAGMKEEKDNFISEDDRTTWGSVMSDIESAYKKGCQDTIDKAKAAFDKAVGWCSTYPWYEGVVEEFVKALEE